MQMNNVQCIDSRSEQQAEVYVQVAGAAEHIPREGRPLKDVKSCSTDVMGFGTMSTVGAEATAADFATGCDTASTGLFCCLLL